MKPLLRTNGGIAILTNGTPLWLQPAPWSEALKATLEQSLDATLSFALREAGYDVTREAIDYHDDLTVDQITGSVFSAMSPDKLSRPNQRKVLANSIRRVLAPHAPFREKVHVASIIGRLPGPTPRNAMD